MEFPMEVNLPSGETWTCQNDEEYIELDSAIKEARDMGDRKSVV